MDSCGAAQPAVRSGGGLAPRPADSAAWGQCVGAAGVAGAHGDVGSSVFQVGRAARSGGSTGSELADPSGTGPQRQGPAAPGPAGSGCRTPYPGRAAGDDCPDDAAGRSARGAAGSGCLDRVPGRVHPHRDGRRGQRFTDAGLVDIDGRSANRARLQPGLGADRQTGPSRVDQGPAVRRGAELCPRRHSPPRTLG